MIYDVILQRITFKTLFMQTNIKPIKVGRLKNRFMSVGRSLGGKNSRTT